LGQDVRLPDARTLELQSAARTLNIISIFACGVIPYNTQKNINNNIMVSRKKAKGKARKAAAQEATKQTVVQESLGEQMQRLKLLSDKNLFTVKQNEYGNQSAYATCFIPKHTLIFAELPALRGGEIETASLYNENGTHQCHADDDDFLQNNLLGMDESTRASIWELHDQFIDTYTPTDHPLYSPNEKRLLGIIKSNAYHSNDERSRGLYLTISRFNHSCKPNVGYGFNGWEMRLYTTSDVHKGEELCTCYSDMVYFHNRLDRGEYLKRKFNFHCICHGCNRKDNEVDGEQSLKQSDTRRERLRFLAEALSRRDRTAVTKSDLEMIMESIDIMKLESLEHNISTTYRLAREWALKLGEDEASLEEKCLGAELYVKLLGLSKGETHPETIQARIETLSKSSK
jgi:hypothetical protein